MKITPQDPHSPRLRGGIIGEIMSPAAIIRMDRRLRDDYIDRRIGRIIQPISLAAPNGIIIDFPGDRMAASSAEDAFYFPNDPSPPPTGAPAAAMPRAA